MKVSKQALLVDGIVAALPAALREDCKRSPSQRWYQIAEEFREGRRRVRAAPRPWAIMVNRIVVEPF